MSTVAKTVAIKATAAKATATKPAAIKVTVAKAKPNVKIQPLEDRVVILPAESADTMRGPLYIPDTAKEKPTQGEVLAVGPGRIEKGERVKVDLGVGDIVIYGKYGGMPYQAGEHELIIVRASEILAKIG